MKILVFGGTGAMGVPLVKLLQEEGHDLYITSRSQRKSGNHVHYLVGNAHDFDFLKTILKTRYDVIIDFMVYGSAEFAERYEMLLENTEQYIFFSSSRVYANSDLLLTEESARLLDVCQEREYLESDEYALAKAREEDLLRNSGKQNWTIIRPYITYNEQRLQLGVYEKENWLYRALMGRAIVIPKDIAQRVTSLTYGGDVAYGVAKLIGNNEAYGQVFHIVSDEYMTWEEILEIYLDVIERKTGKRPRVLFVETSSELKKIWNSAQITYDRLYDRKFDSSKVKTVCGEIQYKAVKEGIQNCLQAFLEKPEWIYLNWKFEAWADKCAKEHASLREIPGNKLKIKYLLWRYFE